MSDQQPFKSADPELHYSDASNNDDDDDDDDDADADDDDADADDDDDDADDDDDNDNDDDNIIIIITTMIIISTVGGGNRLCPPFPGGFFPTAERAPPPTCRHRPVGMQAFVWGGGGKCLETALVLRDQHPQSSGFCCVPSASEASLREPGFLESKFSCGFSQLGR